MNAIEDQLIRADLVLTSGGVSVGAYDVVKEVLSRLGTVAAVAEAATDRTAWGSHTVPRT